MTDPPRVTVAILTFNEEAHIADCLASVAWADHVLVLDSGSTDRTVAIAAAMGARVVAHGFENFSRQRQHALSLVTTPWTLFIDADERVPADLAAEIPGAIKTDYFAGFWITRRNRFWGRTLRGGGWWPDPQLRLLRTDRAHYDLGRTVHEVPELDGTAGRLREPLVHLNYDSWAEFRGKQRVYAGLEAERRHARGETARRRSFLAGPVREAWRRFIGLAGWRDGATGAALAASMAYYEWVTLLELSRRGPAPEVQP